MRVDLQPIAKHEGALLSYLDANFRRLADALALLTNVEQAVVTFTGAVEIDTGLPEVYNVVASFYSIPVAGACFLQAYVSATEGNIVIVCLDSSFNLSTTECEVTWFAIGK